MHQQDGKDNQLLQKLLASESETENNFPKHKLGQYFVALANEANLQEKNEAHLLFGINDKGKITGTNISDDQLNDYKKEIADHTSPKASFTAKRIKTVKGVVIILQIPVTPQGMQMSWKGHRYIREGESLVGLNDFKFKTILNQKNKIDWSNKIIANASLKDLCPDAIKMVRKQYREKWNDITFLNKAKVCRNGAITHTTILLIGKPESAHFISPATPEISWILKDKDNIEKDYQHFTCPLLLESENVGLKIRNLKYRYIKDGTLFPDEVDQYDPYIIREALNNCIAHQDYTLGGKKNVVEREDGVLPFVNKGSFIPENVEKVVKADAPETNYRNTFLANAMVQLNMIDTIGSGIKKMFIIQKDKFFPLPEYDLNNNEIKVQIIGKVIDMAYARKIAKMPNISLEDIILLDKVVKKKELSQDDIKTPRSKKLIEGRKPNLHISTYVAKVTEEKSNLYQK